MKNLISYRKKYKTHEFYKEIFRKKNEIIQYIDDSQQFMITIIHSYNNVFEEPEYDIEVLFKGLKEADFSHEFKKVENFMIKNSICAEMINDVDKMPMAVAELNKMAIDMDLSIKRNIWVQYTCEKNLYIYLYAERGS